MISRLLICLHFLTISVLSAFATIVTFANTQTFVPPTFQVCNTKNDLEVCCIPLDVDGHDGRGFGWFHADLISFSHINTPQTNTTVFGRRSPHPCFDDFVTTKQGRANWQYFLPPGSGGAGSAAVVQTLTIGSLKTKYPDVIVIGDVRYEYAFDDQSGIITYWDDQYNVIAGRPLEDPTLRSLQDRDEEQ